MEYPILVENYKEDQAAKVVCASCHLELTYWDPSEGDPYDLCLSCDSCGGGLRYKYQQADRCPGCATLGFYEKTLDYCCSRVCQLQSEYAATLKSPAQFLGDK